jgi:hypothetical protein
LPDPAPLTTGSGVGYLRIATDETFAPAEQNALPIGADGRRASFETTAGTLFGLPGRTSPTNTELIDECSG